jgi:hypothetical protein
MHGVERWAYFFTGHSLWRIGSENDIGNQVMME